MAFAHLKYAKVAFVLLGSTAIALPAWAQKASPAPAASEQAGGLEDIVVTAQKREQNLQVVPVAVTALTAGTLQAARFQNLLNISAFSPGLVVRPSAGGIQGVSPSMRGIYGLATIGQDQGVALYLDGVYINGIFGAAFDVANVERIEVLRGPQGTLFGRNSLGGAVNVITRDPTGQFGARQELTYGNYNQFRSKTHVELPAWGPLSASITYLHNERRGDIRNLGAGTVWDYTAATSGAFGKLTSPKYLGDQNVNAVSTAVKLEATPDLKFVYKFNWAENHYTPTGEGVAGIDSGSAIGANVLATLAAQPNQAILSPITPTRPDALNNAFSVPGYLRTFDHNLTATYRLSDAVSFKNVLSYRTRLINTSDQIDGLGGLISTPTSIGQTSVGSPYGVVVASSQYNDKQWSDEFQMNINTQWFDVTAGYIHFSVKSIGGNRPGSKASFSFSSLPGFVIPSSGLAPSNVKSVSDAAYFQDEFHITSKVDLLLGARITADTKDGVDRTFPGVVRAIAYRGSQPTYLAGVNFKPADHILTYVKYSTGYVSGGQLSALTYAASTAKSYEAGIKADWLDNRLRTNLAVYHADYKQLQFLTSGAAFGIAAGQVIFNGGDARVNGAEFETTLVPMSGLTLTGNVSYTDFKYKSVNPILGTLATVFPLFTPKWTSALSAEYQTADIINGAHLLFRADATYTSQQFVGRANATQAPGYFASSLAPSAWIINGRVALAGYQIAGTKAELAVWARNLTDNRGRVGGTDFGFLNGAIYQPARTFGVDLTFDL